MILIKKIIYKNIIDSFSFSYTIINEKSFKYLHRHFFIKNKLGIQFNFMLYKFC